MNTTEPTLTINSSTPTKKPLPVRLAAMITYLCSAVSSNLQGYRMYKQVLTRAHDIAKEKYKTDLIPSDILSDLQDSLIVLKHNSPLNIAPDFSKILTAEEMDVLLQASQSYIRDRGRTGRKLSILHPDSVKVTDVQVFYRFNKKHPSVNVIVNYARKDYTISLKRLQGCIYPPQLNNAFLLDDVWSDHLSNNKDIGERSDYQIFLEYHEVTCRLSDSILAQVNEFLSKGF